MQTTTNIDTSVIHECTDGSFHRNMPFPQVVQRLVVAGFERYEADLVRLEKTYYMPSGASHVEPSPFSPAAPVAESFAQDQITAALRAIQRNAIDYPEFLRRIMAAGCVNYGVFLRGKRAIYWGRDGDFHVEWFPGAGQKQ